MITETKSLGDRVKGIGNEDAKKGRGAEGDRARPFFRFHLTTVLLLVPLGSLLIWLNLRTRLYPAWPGEETTFTGFPFEVPCTTPVGAIVTNIVACFVIFLSFGILFEWFDRRSGGGSPLRMLRAICLGSLLPGLLSGIYSSHLETARSSTFVAWGLPFPTVFFEKMGAEWCDYVGPQFLVLNPLAVWFALTIALSLLGSPLRWILRYRRGLIPRS